MGAAAHSRSASMQTPPLSSHHSQYKLSQCRKQDALYLSNPLSLDPTLPTDPRNQIILSEHARLANQPRGWRVARLEKQHTASSVGHKDADTAANASTLTAAPSTLELPQVELPQVEHRWSTGEAQVEHRCSSPNVWDFKLTVCAVTECCGPTLIQTN